MNHTTRAKRHQAEEDAQRNRIKKATLPLLSTALLAGPILANIAPTHASAEELESQTPTYMNVESFIARIAPIASQVADANDLYASVMIAQALLESNFGNSELAQAPYYNLFGVKGSYRGQSVQFSTLEYLNGNWVQMLQPFRQYNSYWEAIVDQANVLMTTSFNDTYHYSGVWKRNTISYQDATAWLTGTYATDPNYSYKLNSIIEKYGLTMYDTPSYLAPDSQASYEAEYNQVSQATGIDVSASANATAGTHTVVSGDTLWDIAQYYGLTLEQLMTMNNLTDYNILIGTVLNV
ncbi:MAG: glucosaminidase domain-containing protein [Lactobacillales bacterium]|jgi:flagellum-specific peptidoglycan hydrolase FlgJ|nr:glucosaminidase domain-containing protein [Lactobacillales bacterium]